MNVVRELTVYHKYISIHDSRLMNQLARLIRIHFWVLPTAGILCEFINGIIQICSENNILMEMIPCMCAFM